MDGLFLRKASDPLRACWDLRGAGAVIAFGLGAAADAIVGGFGRSIALQPLSVSNQTGVNFAPGVVGLTLRYVR